jgi:hypothetical protein
MIKVRGDTADWRSYLNPDERKRIRELDRAIAKADKAVSAMRAERETIQNRATKRRGYAMRETKPGLKPANK